MAKFRNLGERIEPGHVFSVVRFCGREISEPSPDVVGRPVVLGYSLCPIRRHEISKLCRAEGPSSLNPFGGRPLPDMAQCILDGNSHKVITSREVGSRRSFGRLFQVVPFRW